MELEVAGDRYVASGVSLVLGDDFFSQVDTEFDLPDNTVRMFKPEGCQPDQLVYWGAAYSQADLLDWDHAAPAADMMALVNGKRVMASLDTGATSTSLDAAFADSAGVKTVVPAAAQVQGFGMDARASRIGQAATVALGDEKVNNVRLQVMNLTSDFSVSVTGSKLPERLDTPLMLLGADFFRAHRVYIDVRDHLVLFSYSGGPVFSPMDASKEEKGP